jgi:hypothetical protein
MRTIIGIDAGMSGAIAIWSRDLFDGDGSWQTYFLPLVPTGQGTRQQLNIQAFADLMRGLEDVKLVVVENPPIIPKFNSAQSIGSLQRNYGEIRGVLTTLGYPAEYPTPTTWQNVILPGRAKGEKASIPYVLTRYPHIDIAKPAISQGPRKGAIEYYDGVSDAVCLCEYGRRLLSGRPGELNLPVKPKRKARETRPSMAYDDAGNPVLSALNGKAGAHTVEIVDTTVELPRSRKAKKVDDFSL